MDAELLARVRKKVEDGHELEGDELEVLERAAREAPGPALKVAYAQALLNADAAERALVQLIAVRRDFPRDGQALLALARALIALERWKPAEKALDELLRVNPEDPEAYKALALLAMRRGEMEKARQFVRRVLEIDPLDGEAQLLDSELKAGAEPETRDDFVQALVAQLSVQSTPHLLQSKELLVRLGQGGVARLDLDSLYAEHRRSTRPLKVTVEALAKDLAERALGLPEGRDALLTQVLPVLRDDRFLERAVGSARREGPAGLWVFYVIEDPELVRYVPEQALETHGVTLADLDVAAWKRLGQLPTPVRNIALESGQLRLSASPTGLYALAAADGHDAARLLTAPQQELIREAVEDAGLRVYLGLRELVLFCKDDGPKEQLEGLQPTREGISGAYRFESDRLVAVEEWKE
ncbi:MAG: tetratricopeptide repeat protein [Archangiaceae bacterium]|nr:tetratricopeptide repeat protein [Archangiaceae bacterium]